MRLPSCEPSPHMRIPGAEGSGSGSRSSPASYPGCGICCRLRAMRVSRLFARPLRPDGCVEALLAPRTTSTGFATTARRRRRSRVMGRACSSSSAALPCHVAESLPRTEVRSQWKSQVKSARRFALDTLGAGFRLTPRSRGERSSRAWEA